MKSDQYRESTGRRLRDAYMSEPVQRILTNGKKQAKKSVLR